MGVVLHEAEAAGIFITAIQASSRIEKNETNKALNPGKQKDALPKNYSSIAPENVPSQKERIVFQASRVFQEKICWFPVSRVISKARCLLCICIYIYIWVFPKMGSPTTIGFPTKNDHFGV